MINYIEYKSYEELKEKALSQIDLEKFFIAYEGINFMVFISNKTAYKKELLDYYTPSKNYVRKSGSTTFKVTVPEIIEKYGVNKNSFLKSIHEDSFIVGYLEDFYNYCSVCGEVDLHTSKNNPFGYGYKVCEKCKHIVENEKRKIYIQNLELESEQILKKIESIYFEDNSEYQFEKKLSSLGFKDLENLKTVCKMLNENKSIYGKIHPKLLQDNLILFTKPKYFQTLKEWKDFIKEKVPAIDNLFSINWNYLIPKHFALKAINFIFEEGRGLKNIFYNENYLNFYNKLLIEFNEYNVFPQVSLFAFIDSDFFKDKLTVNEFNYLKLSRVNFLITKQNGQPIKVIELIKENYTPSDLLKEKIFSLAGIELIRVNIAEQFE